MSTVNATPPSNLEQVRPEIAKLSEEEAKVLAEFALRFIDSHIADPDITVRMAVNYERLTDIRKHLGVHPGILRGGN